MERTCPNCGSRLVDHRRDLQQAGHQEVAMRWAICENCRHVALQRWDFTGPAPVKSQDAGDGEDDAPAVRRTA